MGQSYHDTIVRQPQGELLEFLGQVVTRLFRPEGSLQGARQEKHSPRAASRLKFLASRLELLLSRHRSSLGLVSFSHFQEPTQNLSAKGQRRYFTGFEYRFSAEIEEANVEIFDVCEVFDALLNLFQLNPEAL